MPRIAYLRNLRCGRWVNRAGPVELTVTDDAAGIALLHVANPHWESFPEDPGGPKYVMEGEARLLNIGTQVVEVNKAGFVFVIPVLPVRYRPRLVANEEAGGVTFLVGWGNQAIDAGGRYQLELTFLRDRKKTQDNLLLTDEWFTLDRALLPDTHFLDVNQTFASLITEQGYSSVRVACQNVPAGKASGKDSVVILGSDKKGAPLAIFDQTHRAEVHIRLTEGLTLAAILANTAEDRRLFQFDPLLLPASVRLTF